MQDMKLSAEEVKENSTMLSPGDGPRYPWGLCLNLDDATLKKLGIKGLPEVGSKMNLDAVVVVTSVSQNQQQDGDKTSSVSLQITNMELSASDESDDDRASKLYPGMAK